jgi:hypothetical protein
MLIGKTFRFTRPTTGIQLVDGTAKVRTVPADGIIKVLSGPNANGRLHDKGLVYVLWEGQTVALFGGRAGSRNRIGTNSGIPHRQARHGIR